MCVIKCVPLILLCVYITWFVNKQINLVKILILRNNGDSITTVTVTVRTGVYVPVGCW